MIHAEMISKNDKPIRQTIIHDPQLVKKIIAICNTPPSEKAKELAQKRRDSVASLFAN